MSKDFLNEIVRRKQKILEVRRVYYENLKAHLASSKYARYGLFRKAISVPGGVNLIAEIKKASPSQGVIRPEFNVEEIARVYQDNNAAAISVLTEEDFFLGKPAHLKQVNEHFSTPTLMKDFIIDELQLFEARYCGASAVLLIVAILRGGQLKDLLTAAHDLDLDCLVEIHDEQELDRALQSGAGIIGVNNRDLHTFKVDLKTSERLIPMIPQGKQVVAESGIKTRADVKRLQVCGANAVLVGETFLREKDIAQKIRDLMDDEN